MGSRRRLRDASFDFESYDSDSLLSPHAGNYGSRSSLGGHSRSTVSELLGGFHQCQEQGDENFERETNALKNSGSNKSRQANNYRKDRDVQYDVPYYDPRSWVWKDKPDATFAVVVEAPPKYKESPDY